jgi:RNA recognition motif-containing protein
LSGGLSETEAWFRAFFQSIGERMFKKIYVGNLSFQTPEDEVRKVFEQYGSVRSASVITDRESGRSKGFGFVEMDEEDALKAIAGLSGSELNGRRLTVNEAKPLVRRASSDGEYRGAPSRRMRY